MTTKNPEAIRVPLPNPLYSAPYQSGITDPLWPEKPPRETQLAALRADIQEKVQENRIRKISKSELTDAALKDRYLAEYAGRVSRQKCMTIMRADVLAESREELINLLKLISEFSIDEIDKLPSHKHTKLLEDCLLYTSPSPRDS